MAPASRLRACRACATLVRLALTQPQSIATKLPEDKEGTMDPVDTFVRPKAEISGLQTRALGLRDVLWPPGAVPADRTRQDERESQAAACRARTRPDFNDIILIA